MKDCRVIMCDRTEDDLFELSVKVSDDFSGKKGQFMIVAFPGNFDLKKSLTISKYDEKKNEVVFLINLDNSEKDSHEFKKILSRLNSNQVLKYVGPFEKLDFPKEDKPVVFIAGGIGVTSIYTVFLDLLKSKRKSNAYLFYSSSGFDDMVLYDSLLNIKNENKIVNFFLTRLYTKFGIKKFAIDSIKDSVPEFNNCMFYVCGSKGMIHDMTELLLQNDVKNERIITEEF